MMQTLILIVEDSDADFEAAFEVLNRKKPSNPVHRCYDGDEAIDFLYARAEPSCALGPLPGLILLDLHLPGTDGLEVLECVKRHPRLKRIPVTVMTTSDHDRDIRQCYEAGANSYVQKPMSFDLLSEAVGKMVDYWLDLVILPNGVRWGAGA